MKIEKGKLYYNGKEVYKSCMDCEDNSGFISNKIAVHCPTKEDVVYVEDKTALSLLLKCDIVVYLDGGWDYVHCHNESYHLITIDQFKEFYPMSDKEVLEEIKNKLLFSNDIKEERKSLAESDLSVISDKTDEIVQNVVQKYQQRSNVGIKKYGTTLQQNTDGIDVFLNHLQEELMDATLYIEKLKNKFAQLKKDL